MLKGVKFMSIYYKISVALINKGRTEGLEKKIDILWMDGKLSDDERNKLIAMLNPDTKAE